MTLMHTFNITRVDYGSDIAIHAGLNPIALRINRMKSVLNAAAILIGGISKFGHYI